MTDSQQQVQLPPLKFPQGIDNRSREYAVSQDALRVCDNLDVTRDGGLLSRKGMRSVAAGDCHSIFAHPGQRFALVVIDGQLSRMDSDETITALVEVVGTVAYAIFNDDVYWTDGKSVGRVLASGELGVWGMNSPPSPLVTVLANGGLHAGTYQVAMTAIHSSGIESGASEPVVVTLAEGEGLSVTTPAASGVQFAIYRTTANGGKDELRQAFLANPATAVALGIGSLGKHLETLYVVKPIPGQCIAHHKGRLWVASGNVVWFTDAKSPHWLRPEQGYYQFESRVSMLGAAEDGLYVGLYDRVYFLQGTDPEKMTQRPVSSVGAVPGSATEIPYDVFLGDSGFPTRQCAWWDREGFLCIGKPGGILIRPTKPRYSAGESAGGSMTYRADSGLRQLVTALSTTSEQPLVAKDTLVMETFSNAVVLNTQ